MADANTSIPYINFPFIVANISKLKKLWSSAITFHDVPWKIYVEKVACGEQNWLTIFLLCAIEDDSRDWSHSAFATFKLVPFSANKNAVEYRTAPYVFDSSDDGFGSPSFIKWDELFKAENNYVKNDTISDCHQH